jgi:DNA-binding transcriptional LysR family regulator
MDVEALRMFVSVAHRGSFAAAAKEQDLDPSSVSRVIAGLEDALGLRLFQRSTRKMSLTEAGDLYLAKIEPLIDEMERARTEALNVSAGARGTLRITASVTFGQTIIMPLLPKFRALHPELKLDGLFTDQNVDLIQERIDLAVRLGPSIDGDLIATKLMDTQYRVVASPDYLARHAPIERPADLAHHACLLFALRAFRSRWIFRDAKGVIEEVPIHGDITLSPAGSLVAAARDGLGPSLLPDYLVDREIKAGRLMHLLPDFDVTATTFSTAAWLIYPSRAYLPNKVRAMIDFLKSEIADLRRR